MEHYKPDWMDPYLVPSDRGTPTNYERKLFSAKERPERPEVEKIKLEFEKKTIVNIDPQFAKEHHLPPKISILVEDPSREIEDYNALKNTAERNLKLGGLVFAFDMLDEKGEILRKGQRFLVTGKEDVSSDLQEEYRENSEILGKDCGLQVYQDLQSGKLRSIVPVSYLDNIDVLRELGRTTNLRDIAQKAVREYNEKTKNQ